MDSFIHLHVHSHYSLLKALNSPKELVATASELGFQALALTDFGICGGFPKFATECAEAGIKPIFGLEAYLVPDMKIKEKGERRSNVLLIAKNREGYRNLLDVSTEAHVTGFYNRPRIDFSYLSRHAEGMICATANLSGHIPSLIYAGKHDVASNAMDAYKGVFGDDFYAEIMFHRYPGNPGIEEDEKRVMGELFAMARSKDVRCFCSNDVRYCKKKQAKAHDALMCIQPLRCLKDQERFSMNSDDFYMKTAQEMASVFSKHPELLKTTLEIVEKVEDDVMESGGDYVPGEDISSDVPPAQFLRELVIAGMQARGIYDKPEYRERMEHELRVFSACGYVRYFLVLWDFINNARSKGIRIGAGRGSAAGSLCLYALGVTALDPLKYDLLFERFLSVETVQKISAEDFGVEARA